MVERTSLSPRDVVITRTVAKFGNTSYSIAAISSVSVQYRETANKNVTSAGILMMIGVVLTHYFFDWANWTLVGITAGAVFFVMLILSAAFPIKTATLVLTTASREIHALTSRDIPGIEELKLAIEDAFTMRG